MISRVAREHVAESGFDTHPHEREATGGLPVGRLSELVVAELDAGLLVRVGRMRLRQAHGHVEVVGPGGERPREDGGHELGLDGVHDVGCAVLPGYGCHAVGV